MRVRERNKGRNKETERMKDGKKQRTEEERNNTVMCAFVCERERERKRE